MKVYNEMQASLPASEPPSVKEDEQAENNHELPRVSLYNEQFPLTGTEMSVITGDDAQCTTQGKRRIAANVSRSIEIIDADRTNKVAHLFETDAASMANCLARLGIPGKHSLLTQRETFDGLYEGILDRVCSHDFEQFHGAVVRFRELCRYKSSALVKELVRKLFETDDDVNRSLVCECSDVIKGLQLMIETSGVSMRQKHLVCHIACEKETLGSCCFGSKAEHFLLQLRSTASTQQGKDRNAQHRSDHFARCHRTGRCQGSGQPGNQRWGLEGLEGH